MLRVELPAYEDAQSERFRALLLLWAYGLRDVDGRESMLMAGELERVVDVLGIIECRACLRLMSVDMVDMVVGWVIGDWCIETGR